MWLSADRTDVASTRLTRENKRKLERKTSAKQENGDLLDVFMLFFLSLLLSLFLDG